VTLIMAAHQHSPLSSIVKSMVFWPYFGEGGHIWPILAAGWTLNYEIAFYALIGGLLFLPRRHVLVALVATLCGLSMLHASVSVETAAPLMAYTNPIILEFAAGVLLAELRLRSRLPGPYWVIPMLGAAALILWLFAPSILPDGWTRLLLWGVPSVLIVTSAVLCEAAGKFIRVPALKMLGDASYAIYLVHPLLVQTIIRHLSYFPLAMRIIAAVTTVTLIGVLIHFSFERPVTRGLRRLGASLQRPESEISEGGKAVTHG
jgi:exopolysaccharide production protein ExoZ